MAYVARTAGVPRAGSDAKEVLSIPLPKLGGRLGEFAFDHSQVPVYTKKRVLSLQKVVRLL